MRKLLLAVPVLVPLTATAQEDLKYICSLVKQNLYQNDRSFYTIEDRDRRPEVLNLARQPHHLFYENDGKVIRYSRQWPEQSSDAEVKPEQTGIIFGQFDFESMTLRTSLAGYNAELIVTGQFVFSCIKQP